MRMTPLNCSKIKELSEATQPRSSRQASRSPSLCPFFREKVALTN